MSEATQPAAPRIQIADHRVALHQGSQWQLSIRWHFANNADQTVYVLLAQPLVTTIADPLVLDHSAREPSLPLDPNAVPDFEIVKIEAQETLERWLEYRLALPAALRSFQIVGRFGYSTAAPDPAWEQSKNWQQVARWQRLVESNAATVTVQP